MPQGALVGTTSNDVKDKIFERDFSFLKQIDRNRTFLQQLKGYP